MIQEEISLIVSSETASVSNKTADGSRFEILLDEPLSIPSNARQCQLSVEQANIWWTVPNVTTANNTIHITGPDTLDVVQNYTVVIPTGLYDLTQLSNAILRELENDDAKVDPSPLIALDADESTSKVIIRFNYPDVSIDFTQANNLTTLLGFNEAVYGPYAGAPENVLAPNVAKFNSVSSFLIHSDLISKGIKINNTYQQIVAQVLIDVPPGSQITSQPFNPPRINSKELIGTKKNIIRMWLTDQSNIPVDTNGEDWSCRIVIRYTL